MSSSFSCVPFSQTPTFLHFFVHFQEYENNNDNNKNSRTNDSVDSVDLKVLMPQNIVIVDSGKVLELWLLQDRKHY